MKLKIAIVDPPKRFNIAPKSGTAIETMNSNRTITERTQTLFQLKSENKRNFNE